jgi:hypothetical protein
MNCGDIWSAAANIVVKYPICDARSRLPVCSTVVRCFGFSVALSLLDAGSIRQPAIIELV